MAKRFRVLVIDDDPSIREYLETIGTRQGYDVFPVEDGERALETLQETRPDIVTLDVVLPGMDGLEIARRTREVRTGSKLDESTDMGPLISEAEAVRVERWVQEAVAAGALGVELGGPQYYQGCVLEKPAIGEALREIEPVDIIKSHKILFATALLALALFLSLRMGGGS